MKKVVLAYSGGLDTSCLIRWLKDKGYDISAGSTIEYVISVYGDKISDKARELDGISKDEIDSDYYVKNQIVPNVEKIFEVLGYDAKTLIDSEQQSLNKFF